MFVHTCMTLPIRLTYRLYPARADLQSLKIYSPKIKIDYHEVVEALLTGQEVLGKDVNFGPSYVPTCDSMFMFSLSRNC